ncbi:hypothetical protein [Ruegeria sp. A3M17]|uniref:hypothetical protein n=1 Tax=Ruegeria sp. A3M17 TaxID=2267229 RepID=UPI000DEAC9D5|nr:hypothetical protein [Ruegeria sp. A3M17]RBW57455.1 hypothetical protein DS906_11660 [Ruegeria sp. A3M17]
MQDTLGWIKNGVRLQDGSALADWELIYQDDRWRWQYDTHELTFGIYHHDGQYWKLYQVRFVAQGASQYSYSFGGQACRMVQVEYTKRARSTHSHMLMDKGQVQWIRTYEYDPEIMKVVRHGDESEKYGAPFTEIEDQRAA